MAPTAKAPRFNPVKHVCDELERISRERISSEELSSPARTLAVVLAARCRLMADGTFAVWRGSASLAAVTGLHRKTVDKARRELLAYGFFERRRGRMFVPGPDNESVEKPKARRVIALTLVRDVRAYREARKANRASAPALTVQATQGVEPKAQQPASIPEQRAAAPPLVERSRTSVDVAPATSRQMDNAQVESVSAPQSESAPTRMSDFERAKAWDQEQLERRMAAWQANGTGRVM